MTLEAIQNRMTEIKDVLNGESEYDLEALETEFRSLQDAKGTLEKKVEKRSALLADIAVGVSGEKIETRGKHIGSSQEDNPIGAPAIFTQERHINAQREEVRRYTGTEERGKALIEKRSITVASNTLVVPTYYSDSVNPTFNVVSTLLDRVNTRNLVGGESYRQAYVVSWGTGDYTAEGVDYPTTDPVFGYANVAKTGIKAYSQDTEEALKLPLPNYDALIVSGIRTALRRKMTREILVGDGTPGHFVGIFSAQATAIDSATNLAISTIDEDTLANIVFSFGGDEDVEDAATLVLNKSDLRAFALLRDANGNKIHTIQFAGNTGMIDTVPYVINSACKSVASGAQTGDYAMAYGPLSGYELAIFSPMDIKRSEDYLFKSGQIAHRGSVFAGGNVTRRNAFLRVQKA
jgi:HK97 family phage major capsid protein